MKSHPLLYDKLKRQSPGKVGWDDVIHWMWPLFTVRWAEWRMKHLHLSSCPLTDPVTELPMIYDWPTKPLVLYGFSKHVVECPSYWPNNVHACGFWFLKASLLHFDSQPTAYPELSAFLDKSKDPPIFIGLSSMGSMGFIDNPSGLLRVLEGVVKTVNQNMILFTSAYAPLETAVIAAAKQDQKALSTELIEVNSELNVNKSINENVLQRGLQLFGNKLFCFSGTVPYLWLFPKCCLVIHHGGSGTTAAALHSGVPQVICPFILDQFYWAERMAWIGVSPPPLKRECLIPPGSSETHASLNDLLHAIEEASHPKVRSCAEDYGKRIREEDGVGFAVETICRIMSI
ncbi:hypothetical protein KP509_06G054400 [Ceratopteris richardii]|nr:hypothetical protein KP509_06G054400 [Ceratopteris richardii]